MIVDCYSRNFPSNMVDVSVWLYKRRFSRLAIVFYFSSLFLGHTRIFTLLYTIFRFRSLRPWGKASPWKNQMTDTVNRIHDFLSTYDAVFVLSYNMPPHARDLHGKSSIR